MNVHRNNMEAQCDKMGFALKQPLGMISNYRFNFRTEVVYPTDHVFIFFRICIFLQIFLINISMKPEVTQTNYLYT